MSGMLWLVVLALGPVALAAVALMAWRQPGLRPRRLQRALTWASWGGVVGALVSVGWLAQAGQASSPLWGAAGLGAAIRVDGLSVSLFTMVSLLVVVIARFSSTYLDGDARQGTFLGRLAATAAAVEVLVLADNLVLFWLAWVATSVGLHRLLLFYPERPRAVVAARKKFIVARLGDVFLAGAFIAFYLHFRTGELGPILAGGATTPPWELTIAGILLALTALLKSAQFPTHGWLVEVMETPTPVSALLHAGILNAGPFLILRFSPVFAPQPAAAGLLIVVGGFTALFASVVLRTQPSVKVALGYSSAAHMGFMLFVCGLGVYPAAALHLVAHSFYKAHAFLASGSTVEDTQAAYVHVPARQWNPWRVVLGAVVASALYLGVAWSLGLAPWEQPALLLVGAIVVVGLTQLLGAGFDTDAGPTVLGRTVGRAALVATAFFVLEEIARLILADSLPPLAVPFPQVLWLATVVLGTWALAVAIQVLGWGRNAAWARRLRVHVRHGFYANALFDRLVGAMRPVRLPRTTRGVVR